MAIEADGVVLGIRRRACDDPYESIEGSIENLTLVGDVIEPRTVYEAVAEGSAAARSIAGERVAPTMPVAETAMR